MFVTEVYIGMFVKDDFVRPYMGDFLVVILIYAFVRTFFKYPIVNVAVGVLLFSFFVEILQYFNIVDVLSLGSNRLARTIIGTAFVWEDFIAYTLGVLTTLGCEHWLGPKMEHWRSSRR